MKKALLFIYIFVSTTALSAQNITFINSDNTIYTKDSISCEGNVVIVYNQKIISADNIIYNKKTESVTAEGNVIIKDEQLNTYFMDFFCVSRNFEKGHVKNIKIIMDDNSRLAADNGVIRMGTYELQNAIYTPCYECTDTGNVSWQITADKVLFNPQYNVQYIGMRFELLGMPVFFTPYMSHISPKIKRKTGFLIPKISNSSQAGLCVRSDYFCEISPSQELILKPIFTSKIGHVAWVSYGWRFHNGEINIDTSLTGTQSAKHTLNSLNNCESDAIKKIEKSGYRGHIFAKTRYEINDIWRLRSDINLVSDRYYLKKFPFFERSDRVFASNIQLEGFDDNNYTQMKVEMFQMDTSSQMPPKIAPMLERNYTTEILGGSLDIDSFFTNLYFNQSRSAQKIITNGSWSKKVLLPGGNVFDVKGLVSLKGISVSEKEKSDYNSAFIATPQILCSWQLPLLISSDVMHNIFTPMIGFVESYSNKKYFDIFEEPFSEINYINIFDANRSASSYSIDSGRKIFYGVKLSGYKDAENLYRISIGRSTEISSDFAKKIEASGLKYRTSDIAASGECFITENITLFTNGTYSMRKNKINKIETGLAINQKNINFDIMFFKGKQCFYDPFVVSYSDANDELQIHKYNGAMLSLDFTITKSIKIKNGITIGNDYTKATDPLQKKINCKCKVVQYHSGFEYKNECMSVEFAVERKNYNAGDLRPETIIHFVVGLKNIGI